jgi:hypothetical protein
MLYICNIEGKYHPVLNDRSIEVYGGNITRTPHILNISI